MYPLSDATHSSLKKQIRQSVWAPQKKFERKTFDGDSKQKSKSTKRESRELRMKSLIMAQIERWRQA